MKTGTFEVMEQNEMMAVNGGARSKRARRSAVKAARKNFSAREVVRTAGYLATPVAACASIAVAGATCTTIAPVAIAAGLSVGPELIGICLK